MTEQLSGSLGALDELGRSGCYRRFDGAWCDRSDSWERWQSWAAKSARELNDEIWASLHRPFDRTRHEEREGAWERELAEREAARIQAAKHEQELNRPRVFLALVRDIVREAVERRARGRETCAVRGDVPMVNESVRPVCMEDARSLWISTLKAEAAAGR